MTVTSPRSRSTLAVVLALVLAGALLALPGAAPDARAQDARVGDDGDPVLGAVALSQATHADGTAGHVVIGRHDVFADNLAATALAGRDGALLLTTRGTAPLRAEVLAEVQRVLGPQTCAEGGKVVHLAGGTAAIGEGVARAISDAGYCVQRHGGADRIATAIAIGEALPDPSGTVVLARADDWADAAAIGAWAASTRSRILVTGSDALDGRVADALTAWAPEEILLVGGTAALSAAVADAAAAIAPVRRIAGEARDATAAAIATDVWESADDGYLVGNGYAGTAWAYLFAAAPLGASSGRPILYATDAGPTATSQGLLDAAGGEDLGVGPVVPPSTTPLPVTADLAAVDVALQEVAAFASPLALIARPGVGELWVAERAGRIQAFGAGGTRTVLDIADTVSDNGERGLLGIALSADGRTLWTSSTDNGGASVVDAFDVVGDTVDEASRRQLIRVGQPASNHNGGDLHQGPDGNLWWSLGDGGGSNDRFGHGQRPDTLLATMVRITPTAEGYAIPADNPFVAGGGAPEVWAYGLRNPFRFSFDPFTDEVYIADVGQGAVEEVDVVPAASGGGSNFGWPIFEGTRPFAGSSLEGHVPPVHERTHSQGDCSITGGVVYRGSAIPELFGAYLYSDLCNAGLRAIVVEDGRVVQVAELGVSTGTPVGFGVDHDGEVYALDLGGSVRKVVPG